jgi:MFS family permease
VSEARLRGRQKVVIGVAGATRAVSGGLLATALVVFVGREGSLFAVGMLATVFHLCTMLCAPFWGALSDVTGRRRSLLVGVSGVTTAVSFAFVAVDGVWSLVGLRGVYAAFVVGYGTVMLSLVGALGGTAHRGQAVGFFKSATAAGNVVAKVLVGALLVLLAPGELFLVVGTLSLLSTGVLLRIDDPFSPSLEAVDPRAVVSTTLSRLVPDAAERASLRRTGLGWLYGGLAIRHTAVKGVGSLAPLYLLTQVGVSEVVMGLLLAIGPAAQILLNPYFGRVADRRSRKRTVVFGIAASGVYALVLAAASLPVGPRSQLVIAGSSFVAVAAGFAAMDIGVLAIIGDAVPRARESEFIGLRTTVAGAGGVVGPTVVGVTATVAGYRVAFALMGVLALVAAVVTHRTLAEPERRTPVPAERRGIETQPNLARVPRQPGETPGRDEGPDGAEAAGRSDER